MVENDIEAQDLKELAPVLGGPPWAAGLVGVDQARVSQDHSLDNDVLWGRVMEVCSLRISLQCLSNELTLQCLSNKLSGT